MKALLLLSAVAILPLQAGEKTEGTPARKVHQVEDVATVGGHVRRPGPVKFSEGVTLYAAIQAAGGADEFGATNRVKVIRDGKVATYDLRNDKQKLIPLQAGDLIEIPQKNFFGR